MSAFLCSPEHLAAIVAYGTHRPRCSPIIHVGELGICALNDPTLKALLIKYRMTAEDACADSAGTAALFILLDANLESLTARYGTTAEKACMDFFGLPLDLYADQCRAALSKAPVLPPMDVVKLCHSFEYQACEFDSWPTSQARAIIQRVKDQAVMHLPGWDAAPWSI